jgi:hypothetical protein
VNFTGCANTAKFTAVFSYSYKDGGGASHTGTDSYYNLLR